MIFFTEKASQLRSQGKIKILYYLYTSVWLNYEGDEAKISQYHWDKAYFHDKS